jgi:DNA polymerase I-like protein with 3'-5' exonuclease and polymerase domains
MENVLKLDVPVKVDIKEGNNWLEMSSYEIGRGVE